ncbi:MAG: hypothetical protein NTZ43_01335 [Gemmatimonadetes bacterium]|nr:hypothetical protein [Gemmatimonadota bacterium]
MTATRLRIVLALLSSTALALLSACGGGSGSGGASSDAKSPTGVINTSFARLQSQVLEKSCAFATCHAANNSSGSGLVLTGPDAYAKLVGATPSNANARADGLRLVDPGKPETSLLWHKLNGFTSGHHTRDYGAPMPSAGQSISVEQLQFVRQWIETGASATTDDINPQLLAGTTRPEDVPYVPLAAPAPGAGFQLKLTPFTVKSAFEREIFVYRGVGNTQDTYVNRIQTNMRVHSHHFVLYSFAANTPSFVIPARDAVRDLRDASGTYNFNTVVPMEYHVFFAGTQTQSSDFTFPPGVALKLAAGAALDVNSHYVNSSAQDIVGEAEANLYTVPASQVTTVASALNLSNTDLTLPKGRDTTITKTFRFGVTTRVVMLTSHMHARGARFVIRIAGGPRNGEEVYASSDWAHPPILAFASPIVLNPGEGLTSEVTYHGDANRVVKFGLTSDDEMDIIFGYWY